MINNRQIKIDGKKFNSVRDAAKYYRLKDNTVSIIKQTIKDTYEINVKKPKLCPRFSARIFKNIKISKTPLWLTERLRKSGIRSIHPIVDVTNYVMIELGQPLHAYDLSLLDGPIAPRYAKDKETITLEVDLGNP